MTVTQKLGDLRNPSAADRKARSNLAQCPRTGRELEREKATAQVLRVISRSPGELEPVFATMLGNAVRICEAKFGLLYFREGDTFRLITRGSKSGRIGPAKPYRIRQLT